MKTKSISLIFYISMLCNAAFTQPLIKGQKAAGGDADDNFSCMARTTDGGLLAGGSSYSGISGDKTDNSRGDADYWIVKFNANGNKEWNKTIGGIYRDILVSIIQTVDGGYLLAGYSTSPVSGERTVENAGFPDFWIVKLDAGFNIMWDKAFGTTPEYEGATYRQILNSVQQTSDGGYILSGTSQNNDDEYGTKFFIAKCDAGGNAQWTKTIGVGEGTGAYTQETDGGYIVGGSTYNRGLDQSYYKAVKLDLSGNILWNKDYPTAPPTNDYSTNGWVKCMVPSDSGNFIIGGYLGDDSSIGEVDYRLLKIDGNGTILKDKRIGGTKTDQLMSITKTTDGGWILGGYSNSDISGNKTENHRGSSSGTAAYDYWAVKTDNNFNVQWDKTIGGDATDNLYSVLQISPGKYLLGGASASGISGDKKSASKGGTDYWGVVLKYTPPAMAENKIAFTVYPNPAATMLNIQLKGKSVFNLADKTGRTIITNTIENTGSIDVSRLKPGIYFINTPSGTKQKIIIVR